MANHRKVLLIDDDVVVTAVYESYFQDAGFKVTVANDGNTGLKALQDVQPDAVLLDLSMPNGNGIQWLQQSRSDPRFRDLPVVVLTSGKIGWQVKAAENTVTHVLRKDTTQPANVVRAVVNQITIGSWSA
jgi:CheY-like chemotaxis protein